MTRALLVVGMLLASVLTRASHGLLHRGTDGIALGLGQLSRSLATEGRKTTLAHAASLDASFQSATFTLGQLGKGTSSVMCDGRGLLGTFARSMTFVGGNESV